MNKLVLFAVIFSLLLIAGSDAGWFWRRRRRHHVVYIVHGYKDGKASDATENHPDETAQHDQTQELSDLLHDLEDEEQLRG